MVHCEARVVCCVEVIEHIGRSRPAIRDLGRIRNEVLVITTPNLLFPIIAHDTRLRFCHWLPLGLRARYAALCGRTSSQHSNLFWSPMGLPRELPDFKVTSRFLHYSSRRDYLATFPFYLPNVCGGYPAWRRVPQVDLQRRGLLARALFALCHALPGLYASPRAQTEHAAVMQDSFERVADFPINHSMVRPVFAT
jgi:hypothetical protein